VCSSSFCYCSGHLRALHSFPTRRSSDLSGSLPGDAALFDHVGVVAYFEAESHVLLDQEDRHPVAAQLPEQFEDLLDDHRGKTLRDRKSTRLNSSHVKISYAVFCLKKKKQ